MSEQLEKRIYGIQQIVLKVGHVAERMKRKEAEHMAKWLDRDKMLEWLEQNDIFGHLVGDSMHPELLQRAAPIFSFLYKQERLDEQHIDVLWGTVLHKHEAVRAALLKTLSEIVQDFSSKDIQIQFERLQELQLTDFDPDIFNLLKTMARTVIHSAFGIK